MEDRTLRGFSAVIDNTLRRREMLAQHTGMCMSITHYEQPSWHWVASWTDQTCRVTLRDSELGPLLDRLDALLG